MRLSSPIHIGYRTVGNLKQTRRYVPGTAIWGALTARLARLRHETPGPAQYEASGLEIDENLRFTYLFLSSAREKISCLPWGEESDPFDWEFVDSRMRTAIGDGQSSHPGSLHEVEHLLPISRKGECTYLNGYCWSRGTELSAELLLQLWKSAQFGGERTYGYGRVADVELRAVDSAESQVFGRYAIDADERGPHLRALEPAPVFGHVESTSSLQTIFEPRVEALVGRAVDVSNGRYGLTEAKATYAPGSQAAKDSCWRIGERGLWYSAAAS